MARNVFGVDVELQAAVDELVDGRDSTSGFTSVDYRKNEEQREAMKHVKATVMSRRKMILRICD